MLSAFRGRQVKHYARPDVYRRYVRKSVPDQAGEKFNRKALCDQKMLGTSGWLCDDDFERAALVRRNGGHEKHRAGGDGKNYCQRPRQQAELLASLS